MSHSLYSGPSGDHRRFRIDLADGVLVSIGGGGEGLVYRATRTSGGSSVDVALKMVTNVPLEDYGRVARRASVLSNIEHPNLMHRQESFVGTALIDQDEVCES
jgi:hypothetical protein